MKQTLVVLAGCTLLGYSMSMIVSRNVQVGTWSFQVSFAVRPGTMTIQAKDGFQACIEC